MTKLTIFLLLIVFSVIIQRGSCLQCYQCNSQTDTNCKDLFPTRFLVNCSSPDSFTYNQLYLAGVIPLEYLGGVIGAPRYCYNIILGNDTMIRTCLDTNPINMNLTCQLIDNASRLNPDTRTHMKHCSVCDKDGCNGDSPVVTPVNKQ